MDFDADLQKQTSSVKHATGLGDANAGWYNSFDSNGDDFIDGLQLSCGMSKLLVRAERLFRIGLVLISMI